MFFLPNGILLFTSDIQFMNKVSSTQILLKTICSVVTVEHLRFLPWLSTEGRALTPEEPNQDTDVYPEVQQFPHQDLGSGETCGSLIHKPTLDFPMLETDAPQTCGKLEAWCHPNYPQMYSSDH